MGVELDDSIGTCLSGGSVVLPGSSLVTAPDRSRFPLVAGGVASLSELGASVRLLIVF